MIEKPVQSSQMCITRICKCKILNIPSTQRISKLNVMLVKRNVSAPTLKHFRQRHDYCTCAYLDYSPGTKNISINWKELD